MNYITNAQPEDDIFSSETAILSPEQRSIMSSSPPIDVEKLVREVSDLVSLPEIYLKIRQLMDDPDAILNDFATVVNTDPALAATVLKIVNSAFYGLTGQVTQVSRAINLLGLGQLHDMVLTVSAVSNLNLSNDIETLSKFWHRSIFCGVLSKLLADHRQLDDAESLFIVGLLHELGRLLLYIKYPEESKQAIKMSHSNSQSLSEAERNIFGTDYAAIGQELMTQWKLPEKIQHIVAHHLDPSKATEYIVETNIVYIATMAAVNNFSTTDTFQYQLDAGILATIDISEEDMMSLCSQASETCLDIVNLISVNS